MKKLIKHAINKIDNLSVVILGKLGRHRQLAKLGVIPGGHVTVALNDELLKCHKSLRGKYMNTGKITRN